MSTAKCIAVIVGKGILYAVSRAPLACEPGTHRTYGFSRVITNCRDYTKLMQILANGGKYKGEQLIGRKTIDLIRTNTISRDILAEDFSNHYLAGYGYGYGMRMRTVAYGCLE